MVISMSTFAVGLEAVGVYINLLTMNKKEIGKTSLSLILSNKQKKVINTHCQFNDCRDQSVFPASSVSFPHHLDYKVINDCGGTGFFSRHHMIDQQE